MLHLYVYRPRPLAQQFTRKPDVRVKGERFGADVIGPSYSLRALEQPAARLGRVVDENVNVKQLILPYWVRACDEAERRGVGSRTRRRRTSAVARLTILAIFEWQSGESPLLP